MDRRCRERITTSTVLLLQRAVREEVFSWSDNHLNTRMAPSQHHPRAHSGKLSCRAHRLQGYLAHKKTPTPLSPRGYWRVHVLSRVLEGTCTLEGTGGYMYPRGYWRVHVPWRELEVTCTLEGTGVYMYPRGYWYRTLVQTKPKSSIPKPKLLSVLSDLHNKIHVAARPTRGFQRASTQTFNQVRNLSWGWGWRSSVIQPYKGFFKPNMHSCSLPFILVRDFSLSISVSLSLSRSAHCTMGETPVNRGKPLHSCQQPQQPQFFWCCVP